MLGFCLLNYLSKSNILYKSHIKTTNILIYTAKLHYRRLPPKQTHFTNPEEVQQPLTDERIMIIYGEKQAWKRHDGYLGNRHKKDRELNNK